MANSQVRHQVEEWIRETYLPRTLGTTFSKKKVELPSGQVREIDAVSDDGKTLVEITTSSARTASGKPTTGAMKKIKGEVLDLFQARARRRILCVTEPDLGAWAQRQKELRNFPDELEIMVAKLPPRLRTALEEARSQASREMLG